MKKAVLYLNVIFENLAADIKWLQNTVLIFWMLSYPS